MVTQTSTTTRWGGVVGVGLEYGFSPNWSFGVEYNHLLHGQPRPTVVHQRRRMPARLASLFGTNRIRQDVDLVTARINYRWGGPVVAKY